MAHSNLHGCALVLGTTGLIIRGRSGSGKSGLTQTLINRWNERGRYARWICDDRINVRACKKRILAEAPSNIEGQTEQRFIGIVSAPFEQRGMIDYVIDLIDPNSLQRMPEAKSVTLIVGSSPLQLLQVPEQSISHAADLVSSLVLGKER